MPALSSGFEIETEITVHALELRVPLAELSAPYYNRPRGWASRAEATWVPFFRAAPLVHFPKRRAPGHAG